MAGDYPFNDSSAYPAAPLGFFNEEPHSSFQPLQPNHSHNHVYPNQIAAQQQQQQQQQSQQQPLAPQFAQSGSYPRPTADKRKSDDLEQSDSPHSFEESSRAAAEEDKRRRNTAASARFRIKKKQREQALEKSAKDMSEKVSNLESKVSQLETENKWLKNLLTDKNGGSEEINVLWKEFTKHASQRQGKADSAAKATDRS
jgi:signal recognition particle GTPase